VPHRHNEHCAQRALVPPQHKGHWHDGDWHNGHFGSRSTNSSKRLADHIPLPPNGLPLSCAAPIERERSRAETTSQNGYDLARRLRRQLQRRVRRAKRADTIATRMCRPHWHTATRHDEPAIGTTHRRTGIELNHVQYDERLYHIIDNGQSAQRALVPPQHNGHRHNVRSRSPGSISQEKA
jgi:hypothetical protein